MHDTHDDVSDQPIDAARLFSIANSIFKCRQSVPFRGTFVLLKTIYCSIINGLNTSCMPFGVIVRKIYGTTDKKQQQ